MLARRNVTNSTYISADIFHLLPSWGNDQAFTFIWKWASHCPKLCPRTDTLLMYQRACATGPTNSLANYLQQMPTISTLPHSISPLTNKCQLKPRNHRPNHSNSSLNPSATCLPIFTAEIQCRLAWPMNPHINHIVPNNHNTTSESIMHQLPQRSNSNEKLTPRSCD